MFLHISSAIDFFLIYACVYVCISLNKILSGCPGVQNSAVTAGQEVSLPIVGWDKEVILIFIAIVSTVWHQIKAEEIEWMKFCNFWLESILRMPLNQEIAASLYFPLKKKKKSLFFFCELPHLHCPVKILLPILVPTQLPISLLTVSLPLFLPYFFMSVEELHPNVHNQLSSQPITVTGMVQVSLWFHRWKYMCIFMVDYTLIIHSFSGV